MTFTCSLILQYKITSIITDITIEFTSQNLSRTLITLSYLLILPYMVTLITERTSPFNSYQKIIYMYNIYMFAGISIYGYSDHRKDITIEFPSKNPSRSYITLIYYHIWSL